MQLQLQPFLINAKTISDAWFQIIFNIFENSYRQGIQQGSFEQEQYRLQYPGLAIFIEHPSLDMVPVMPPGLGVPAPTTMEYIEDYFANYLMDPSLAENETYKYASRIQHPMPKGGTQLERVIGLLKKTPLTNQAVIEIGSPDDHDVCIGNDGKLDPPCLRVLDFKAVPVCCDDGWHYLQDRHSSTVCPKCGAPKMEERERLVLTVSVYFRSWDLWGGLPTNLGGIEMLKQYVASETGLANGPMYAYTAGGHIYGFQEEIARIRTYKTQ